MVSQDITYDDLLSEMLDAIGLGAAPSPAEGWVELADMLIAGRARDKTDAQVRGSLERAMRRGKMEKKTIGRRIFYREIKPGNP